VRAFLHGGGRSRRGAKWPSPWRQPATRRNVRRRKWHLVLVVVCLVWNEALASRVPGLPNVTEPRAPWSPIDVAIINAPPNIDGRLSLARSYDSTNIKNSRLRNGWLLRLQYEARGESADSASRYRIRCDASSAYEEITIKKTGEWCDSYDVCEDYDVISGCLTEVPDLHGKKVAEDLTRHWIMGIAGNVVRVRLTGSLKSEVACAEAYIRSQLAPGSVSHHVQSENKCEELKKSNNNGDRSDLVAQTPAQGPSVAPLLWSLLIITSGFLLCLLGGLYFDNKRRLLGAALFMGGALLGLLGFLPWGLPLGLPY